MPESAGERTQDPTPHRRQQAREEGQVAKSQDLGSAAILVLGILTLMLMSTQVTAFVRELFQRELHSGVQLSVDPGYFLNEWWWIVGQLGRTILPAMALLLVGAVLVDVAQVGFLFLPDKLAPDLTRLDPLKGFGRIFSLMNAARLGFGIFKILVVAAVAGVVVYQERNTILGLAARSLPDVAQYLCDMLLWTALKVAVALLILALFDYGIQRWKHEQDLKMTPQEMREEMKNLEGDPQIAARRKAVQRQLAMGRLTSVVPKADVVVTNPTELAVAIQYDPDSMHAPIVVAKGAGTMAHRIRKLALENGIPIIEKKPLAQALFKEVDVNKPIPQDKYAAVAEILAYVYQLKGKKIPTPPSAAA